MAIVGSFRKDGTLVVSNVEVNKNLTVSNDATITNLDTETIDSSSVNTSALTTTSLTASTASITDGSGIKKVQWTNIEKKPTTVSGYGITDAYTKTQVDSEIASAITELRTNLQWKDSVSTYDNIATAYPSPKEGWTVSVEDTNAVYRYDDQTKTWIQIDAGKIPMASSTTDGKMSKEHYTKLEGIAAGAEVNQNSYSTIKVGSATSTSTSKTGTLTTTAGSLITLSLAQDNLTIAHTGVTTTNAQSTDSGSLNVITGTTTNQGHVTGTQYKTLTAGSNISLDATTKGVIKINNTYSYTHPTGDGNLHVPATGTSNNGKFLTAGSTAGSLSWTTPPLATTSANGYLKQLSGDSTQFMNGSGNWVKPANATTSSSGYLPQLAGGTTKYLRADGTWVAPPNTTYSEYTGTTAGLVPSGSSLTSKTNVFLQADGSWAKPEEYVLPTATTSTLGGVVVGTGLQVTSAGALSVPTATTSVNGLMSSTDKTKLNGIATGAEVNQNAYSTLKVGSTTSTSTSKTGTLTATAGTLVSLSLAQDNLTIAHTSVTTTNSQSTDASSANILTGITTNQGHTTGTQYKVLAAGDNIDIDSTTKGTITISNTYKYTHPTGDGSLHVPATGTSNSGKFLTAGSTAGSLSWTTPPLATTSANGYLKKLSGDSSQYMDGTGNWVKPANATTSSSGYLPQLAGGTTKYLRADGTWVVPPDTTYSVYTGGSAGLVPAGSNLSNKTNVFLQADGSWTEPEKYALPAATKTTLGGIKVGSGLAVSTDGTIVVPTATTTTNGLMSSTDKSKLDGVATGAEVNQNAYSTIKVGSSSSTATSKTGSLTATAGSLVSLSLAQDNLTIAHSSVSTTTAKSTNTGSLNLLSGVTTNQGHVTGVQYKTLTAGSNIDISADTAGEVTIANTYKYTHPTGDGNLHVPATGTSNSGKFLMAGSTAGSLSWATPPVASTSAAGYLQKLTGETTKFMRADGSWATPPDTTYSVYSGNAAGLVPSGTSVTDKTNSFLKADGTWSEPVKFSLEPATTSKLGGVIIGSGLQVTTNGTLSVPTATTSVSGLLSSTDKSKLDGIADGANNYTHPSQTVSKTTSKATATHSGTFTAIDSITTTAQGHVSAINTKTITLPDAYVLPAATTSTLGGVKAGSNVSIATDGTLSIADYEPAFTKNTAFNKNFGTSANTVAYGNHTHSEFTSSRYMQAQQIYTDYSSEDMNTTESLYLTNRVVRLPSSSNCPQNLPTGMAYGTLLLLNGGGDTGAQIAFPYSDNQIYFRNWSTKNLTAGNRSWTKIWSDNNFDPDSKANTATVVSASTGLTGGGNLGSDITIAHSTASGYKHVPSGGTENQYLKWSADGTASWSTLPSLIAGSGLVGSAYNGSASLTWSVDATDTATASKIVKRTSDGAVVGKTLKTEIANDDTPTIESLGYRQSVSDGQVRYTTNKESVKSWLGISDDMFTLTLPNKGDSVSYSRVCAISTTADKAGLSGVIMGGSSANGASIPLIKFSFTNYGYSSGSTPTTLVDAILIGDATHSSDIAFITRVSGNKIELWFKSAQNPYSPKLKTYYQSDDCVLYGDSLTTTQPSGTLHEIKTHIASDSITTSTLYGNATSASKLQTSRTINGVSFDGTSNIQVNTVGKLTVGDYMTLSDSQTQFDGSKDVKITLNTSTTKDANTIVVRDSAGDIRGRLLRSTYSDQTTMSGALAFRISTGDNYIRFCSDPAPIREWLQLESSLDSYVKKTGDTMTGVLTAPSYKTTNSTYLTETYCGTVSSESGYAMLWRTTNATNKANEFIGISSNSTLVFRQATGNGSTSYTDCLVYHTNNKPTKADIGLGKVNNWDSSSDIDANSVSQYATTAMVAKVRELISTEAQATERVATQEWDFTSAYQTAYFKVTTDIPISVKPNGTITLEQAMLDNDLPFIAVFTDSCLTGTDLDSIDMYTAQENGCWSFYCSYALGTKTGTLTASLSVYTDTADRYEEYTMTKATSIPSGAVKLDKYELTGVGGLSAADIGLDKVNNWTASSDPSSNSTTVYATTAMVNSSVSNTLNKMYTNGSFYATSNSTGMLVKTNISENSNTMIVGKIYGNSYSESFTPYDTIFQCYHYKTEDKVYNPVMFNKGIPLDAIRTFCMDGVVCFWIASNNLYTGSTFKSYIIELYDTNNKTVVDFTVTESSEAPSNVSRLSYFQVYNGLFVNNTGGVNVRDTTYMNRFLELRGEPLSTYGGTALYLNGSDASTASMLLFGSVNSNNYGMIMRFDEGANFYILRSKRSAPNEWDDIRPFRISMADGYVYTNRTYGAVWNDYAEYFPKELGYKTEPGDIIALSISSNSEKYELATKEHIVIVGVHSDEYGHIIGGDDIPMDWKGTSSEYNENRLIPVGLVGRVRTKFIGVARKGMKVVPSEIPGVGKCFEDGDNPDLIVGYVVENNDEEGIRRIRMKLGK